MVAALLLSPARCSLTLHRRRAGTPRCEELPSFDLTLAKPLGIVFEEADGGGLFVAELQPGGRSEEGEEGEQDAHRGAEDGAAG